MPVGVHTVTVTPPGGAALDLSCWVSDVDTRHGRDDPGSQPDASTATLGLVINGDTGILPPAVEIGSTLVVTTDTHVRFTGTITDVSLGWTEAGPSTPDEGVGQVITAGVLATIGRRVVGDTTWPQELDGARVARALAAAGVTLNPATSDPGTVQVIPRDVDAQPALDVAQATAESSSGVLWSTRAGEIRYADAVHRKGTAPALTLDVCDILVTPTWRRTVEGMTNKVSITYGVGGSAAYTAQNDPSITRYGTFGYSITSLLATLADATALGQLLLVRNSSPVWVMADLPLDLAALTPAQCTALLELEVHSLIVVTGMPTIGGAPTTANLWVEGWAEHLAYGVHTLSLVVSGYCRTAPAPTWNDIDPSWVWGGQTLTEVRRNECVNPQPATASGWSGPSLAVVPRPWDATRNAARITGQAPSSSYIFSKGSDARTSWPAGTTVTVSGTVMAPVGVWLSPQVHNRTTNTYYPGVGAGMVAATGAPQRLSVTYTFTAATAPAGVPIEMAVLPYGANSASTPLPVGVNVYLCDVVVEAATWAGPYFDGDTPDTADLDHAWVGVANASPSKESEWVPVASGMPATLTWDDMTCLGPPANYGRWDDQPANLRWDQVPPSTTWNNYVGA
jgi:hypothetical protein